MPSGESSDLDLKNDGPYIRVTLSASDVVALKVALTRYRTHIEETIDDADPMGDVADITHVTGLLERIGCE